MKAAGGRAGPRAAALGGGLHKSTSHPLSSWTCGRGQGLCVPITPRCSAPDVLLPPSQHPREQLIPVSRTRARELGESGRKRRADFEEKLKEALGNSFLLIGFALPPLSHEPACESLFHAVLTCEGLLLCPSVPLAHSMVPEWLPSDPPLLWARSGGLVWGRASRVCRVGGLGWTQVEALTQSSGTTLKFALPGVHALGNTSP